MNFSSSCNITDNITAKYASACGTSPTEAAIFSDPYEEFAKFLFGSAIYMIVLSLITITANALLLLVVIVDPLKTFKNPTSYFLIGLALSDLLTALIHLPLTPAASYSFISGVQNRDLFTAMTSFLT